MSDLMDGTSWVGEWLEGSPTVQKSRQEMRDPMYADPINKLYRIETVADIRRAWAYINMTRNKSQYTEDTWERVRNRIIRAWQEKIDRDGPPSANLS